MHGFAWVGRYGKFDILGGLDRVEYRQSISSKPRENRIDGRQGGGGEAERASRRNRRDRSLKIDSTEENRLLIN
jgi:hypothetical protein